MSPTPAAKEPSANTRLKARPSAEKKSFSAQTPQPNASALEAVMKMMWNALSDIGLMSCRSVGEISERPDGQKHQSNEKKCRESKNAVDHFPLRDQVHEIAGDQKSFSARNEQRHANVNGAVAERNVR